MVFLLKITPSLNLETLSRPEAKYLSGWSHGKEALKTGSYDSLKGSYYVNCAFYQGKDVTVDPSTDFADFTAPNVWPAQASLPGFREILEELCILIIDTAALVARACDKYAMARIKDYEPGYLERIVKTSTTTKARLLHYYAPNPLTTGQTTAMNASLTSLSSQDHDAWCATHVDHGCLTGLTSAVYIDESMHHPQPSILKPDAQTGSLPVLPSLPSPPNPLTGLYIHARDSKITKISIPDHCLAFQTGEALEVITGGKFRAVPHFVRVGRSAETTYQRSMNFVRNTLAVFIQPNLEEIIDREKGTTFGDFSRRVVGRFS